MSTNLSLTDQSSAHYSTASSQWLLDRKIIEDSQRIFTTPGIFVKEKVRQPDLVDVQSQLSGRDNKIGKNDYVDANALNKAKELSVGLQNIYSTNIQSVDRPNTFMLNNTRLEHPAEAISEVQNTRQDILLFDPQNPKHIILLYYFFLQ